MVDLYNQNMGGVDSSDQFMIKKLKFSCLKGHMTMHNILPPMVTIMK